MNILIRKALEVIVMTALAELTAEKVREWLVPRKA